MLDTAQPQTTAPPTSTGPITVRCPADGRVVGEVPDTGADEVAAAIAELRVHQPAWDQLGPEGRASWMYKFRDWLLDNADELTGILQSETGKPLGEAGFEVPVICDVINYFGSNAAEFLSDEHPKPHNFSSSTKRLIRVYRPHPVVGVITPWNFPLVMPGMDIVPALLAGAAVILKPSEVTPLSAVALARGWAEIGAPPVFTCITGLGPTGAAVVDGVDMVQFTGSTRTGRAIGIRAAERLIPCSLELGGKDPAIVLADADIDRAVNGVAWGGLMNSGQVCISIERVYVEEPIYDEFVSRLTELVGSLRQGHDTKGYTADVGAMATYAQRDIVARHVDDAVAHGAKVTTGGRATGVGTSYAPTVLVDVDHSMACMTEETFGPTIPVMKVADAEEAIRLANDTPYGLSATVWTGDRKRGEEVARRLEVGAVNINDAFSNLLCLPLAHGGWKDSGIGARFGGPSGLRKYCRQQMITVPKMPTMKREILWYPYTAGRGKVAMSMLRALAARDLRRRFGRGGAR